jgi:peptide/nickel transport system substrate-binding protein
MASTEKASIRSFLLSLNLRGYSLLSVLTVLVICSPVLFLLAGCAKEPDIKNPYAITLGSGADAKRLLPFLASDSASGQVSGYIFNGLTKYDKNLHITGELAESWDVSEDGLTLTFHLRKGVKWHDGTEFTSDDVLFTYNAVTNPKIPTPYSSIYGPVKSVEATDRYTVRIRYGEPYAPALESWGMGIMPKHYLEGKDMASPEVKRSGGHSNRSRRGW